MLKDQNSTLDQILRSNEIITPERRPQVKFKAAGANNRSRLHRHLLYWFYKLSHGFLPYQLNRVNLKLIHNFYIPYKDQSDSDFQHGTSNTRN